MQALDRAVLDTVRNVTARTWRRIWSLPVFTLNGYVAFNLPRAVTGVAAALLLGMVAVHGYLLVTSPGLPAYFVGYLAALSLGCLVAVAAITLGRSPAIAWRGWYLGSAVCLALLAGYLLSRFTGPASPVALTGRWDLAPGSFAMALAAGFIAVHASVLSGVNVAHPGRRRWHD